MDFRWFWSILSTTISRKSRDLGLKAFFGHILSEHVVTEIDFGGLGRFLTATSNDEINTLAAARFREDFGRDKVFQLPMNQDSTGRFAATWEHRLVGRTLFDQRLTYLWRLLSEYAR